MCVSRIAGPKGDDFKLSVPLCEGRAGPMEIRFVVTQESGIGVSTMIKIMIFVDGSWLYSNVPRLAQSYGRDYRVDYGKLPKVLAQAVAAQLGLTGGDLDIVRTYLFGSYPVNFDRKDTEPAERRLDFYEMLKEDYHYEVETYAVNYVGHRLRRADRPEGDDFVPREKCVDIALATSMLYFAAIPYAYDAAVAVIGDSDFIPVLQYVRRLGKRVAVASIRGSCAAELADPSDPKRVKDFDTIWIDNLLNELELRSERRQLECQSPLHKGDKKVWTDMRPRKGRAFYCETCMQEFRRQRDEQVSEYGAVQPTVPSPVSTIESETMDFDRTGVITKLVRDKGYGFIQTQDGNAYFFHMYDLRGLRYDTLHEGDWLDFEVKTEPSGGKAGAAQNVRPH